MKYFVYDENGQEWEMETLPRSVTPNFIGLTEEEKQKMRNEPFDLDEDTDENARQCEDQLYRRM